MLTDRISKVARGSTWSLALWRVGLLASSLGLWQLAADRKWIEFFLFSSPLAIAQRLAVLTASGKLYEYIYITAVETLLAFVIGAVLGVVIGMLLALSHRTAQVFDPFLVAVNGLPRPALAPLFVVWFGIGIASKVAVGASIVLFVCLFATFHGMRNTDSVLLQAIRALGATPRQLLVKVQLPSAVPWIVAGLKTSVAMALIGAVIGEFIAASSGLGWYIAFAGGNFDTTGVMAGLIVLGLMAVLLDTAVESLGRRFIRWRPDVVL